MHRPYLLLQLRDKSTIVISSKSMSGTSTAARLVRGTCVTWVRLFVGVLAAVLVTPIYLNYWGASIYGTWLTIISAVSLVRLPGLCHQEVVGNELVKIAHSDSGQFELIFRSGIRIGALVGIVELLIVGILATVTAVTAGADSVTLRSACVVFFIMSLDSGLVSNRGGIYFRAVAPFGHYERNAWWSVADGLTIVVVPALVLPFGFRMAGVALLLVGVQLLVHLAAVVDLARTLRPYRKASGHHDWSTGVKNLWRSQLMTVKSIADWVRQQGVRFMLAPLAGTVAVAGFSTMRTGANFAIQGLHTTTHPLLPELMRFVANRESEKAKAAMATVWIVLVFVLVPAAILLQVVVAPVLQLVDTSQDRV